MTLRFVPPASRRPSCDLPYTCRRDAGGTGFTLIELVMVLVIVALVVGVSAPTLTSFMTARKTADSAAQIVALARHGRNRAISDGRTYRLSVDEQSGQYWLEAQEGGNFVSPGTSLGNRYTLPSGTTARWGDADWASSGTPVGTSPGSQASGNSSIGNLSSGQQQGANGNGMPALPGNKPGQKGGMSKDVKFYPDGRSDGVMLTLMGSSNEKIEMGAPSECEGWRVVKDNRP